MSGDIRDELQELKTLIVSNQNKQSIVNISGKYIKWLVIVISLLTIILSAGVTWGLTQGRIDTVEEKLTTLTETKQTEHTSFKQDVREVRSDVTTLQIQEATIGQAIVDINKNINQIREELQKINRGR